MDKKEKRLSILHPNAAGIDVGASAHYVCVPEGSDSERVKRFECFTPDLYAMARWLKECGVDTVAMEATGVYWIPVFQVLEKEGLEVLLVNAQHVKNVPGRKSDVQDCQWLQQLHSYGLLRGSFRPADEMCVLRSYVRQRESLIQGASRHVHRMQKALTQMNLQLHRAISDITGITGTRIIQAILEGERNPNNLAELKDHRIRCNRETLIKSLTGDYRPEHLFVLRQEYEFYKIFQEKITECDKAVELYYQQLCKKEERMARPILPERRKITRKHYPHFDLRQELYRLTGVDLTEIPGLDVLTLQVILPEVGLNPYKWPTEKHFTSWLGLSPANKITGGRIISSRTRQVINRAAVAFRIAAHIVGRTQTALGAYCRRLKKRLGAPKAITATARKIACLFYRMLKFKQSYVEAGVDQYEKEYQERILRSLQRKAKELGYDLIKGSEPIVNLVS